MQLDLPTRNKKATQIYHDSRSTILKSSPSTNHEYVNLRCGNAARIYLLNVLVDGCDSIVPTDLWFVSSDSFYHVLLPLGDLDLG